MNNGARLRAVELCRVQNPGHRRRFTADGRRISQERYELLGIMSVWTDTIYSTKTRKGGTRFHKTVRIP